MLRFIFYQLILLLVKLYRWLHSIVVKLFFKQRVVSILIEKFKESGVEVDINLVAKNKVNQNLVSKINTSFTKGYETSKSNCENVKLTIWNEDFFAQLTNYRSLGLAQSYIDGLWDCNQLDEFSSKIITHKLHDLARHPLEKLAHYLQFSLVNLQTKEKAYEVAQKHYDLGGGLFESFLDPSMTYSCGYWRRAKNLEEAQQHKFELIARKLKLEPGMRVLDIGCGWGSLCEYLAKNCKVSVVGCNIARDGCKGARKRCRGLPVEILCCDYRELDGKFDRIVTVGFMEHVGPHNYAEFLRVAHRCLDKHGLLLIQTLGTDNKTDMRADAFFSVYIFPNGAPPKAIEIVDKISGNFTMEDWHNFGNDYSKTLMAWYNNFVRNWPTTKDNYENPTKFYRLWTYYLLMAAGASKSRRMQLWQIVLSKDGFPGGYDSER